MRAITEFLEFAEKTQTLSLFYRKEARMSNRKAVRRKLQDLRKIQRNPSAAFDRASVSLNKKDRRTEAATRGGEKPLTHLSYIALK